MNIQIIGTKKSSETRKAERFFKERGVVFHFVDLNERPLSKGEIESVARAVGADELVDEESKIYKSRGMTYMEFDPLEELGEHPLLMKIPVVRNGREATIGYSPDVWKAWIG